jgi:hypothetical protein
MIEIIKEEMTEEIQEVHIEGIIIVEDLVPEVEIEKVLEMKEVIEVIEEGNVEVLKKEQMDALTANKMAILLKTVLNLDKTFKKMLESL